jgi:hypothetical protein
MWIHSDLRLKDNKKMLKKTMIENYQTRPVEVRRIMNKLNIGCDELRQWIK